MWRGPLVRRSRRSLRHAVRQHRKHPLPPFFVLPPHLVVRDAPCKKFFRPVEPRIPELLVFQPAPLQLAQRSPETTGGCCLVRRNSPACSSTRTCSQNLLTVIRDGSATSEIVAGPRSSRSRIVRRVGCASAPATRSIPAVTESVSRPEPQNTEPYGSVYSRALPGPLRSSAFAVQLPSCNFRRETSNSSSTIAPFSMEVR